MMWLLLIPVLYAFLIVRYWIAWKRLPSFNNDVPTQTVISVIVAARNEEENIFSLLECLNAQRYSKDLFEVIIVNDHSSDNTLNAVQNFAAENELRPIVISLPENFHGKKSAIAEGIKRAKGTLIVTTDADCTMGTHWIKTIAQFYETNKPAMMVMPVVLSGNNFLSQLQAQEFLSLTGVTGASLAIKKPLMCNGANLAFEKAAYENMNKETLRNDIATGDDTFLMLQIFKVDPARVMYVKSIDALVTTPAQQSVSAFLNQRIRWTSKVKMYSELYISFTGMLVVLMAALQVFSVCVIVNTHLTMWDKTFFVAMVFILKIIVDHQLIRQTATDLKQPFSLNAFVVWQFLYPVYIIITSTGAVFSSYSWKGRKY